MAAPIMRGAARRVVKCHETITICRAIPPHSCTILWAWGQTQGSTGVQDYGNDQGNGAEARLRRKYTNLDNRYGKIGISAVAAAVCHQGGQRHTAEAHLEPYDRD